MSKPDLRVLMLSSFFPYGSSDPVPQFLRGVADHFVQSAQPVDLKILVPQAPFREQYQEPNSNLGYQIKRFPYFWPRSQQALAGKAMLPTILGKPWLILQLPFLIASEFYFTFLACIKERPAVLWAQWLMPQGVVIAIIARIFRLPYVITLLSPDTIIFKKIPLGNNLARWIFRGASAVSSVSRRALSPAESLFSAEELPEFLAKVQIIPLGIDRTQFAAAKHEIAPLDDQAYFLFIGRLAEKKGVNYFLQAYADLLTQNEKAGWKAQKVPKIVLLGDGPDREKLQQQVKALGIEDKVTFQGFILGEEKIKFLRNAAAVVLPSIVTSTGDAEGMPVVLTEALASGKVLIASDVSGADEVLESGKNGILFKQRDVEGLTAALLKFINLSRHEKFAMQAAALELASHFYWENLAQKYQQLIFNVAK